MKKDVELKTDPKRHASDEESIFCKACGVSHPRNPRHVKPDIQADDFVVRRCGAGTKDGLYGLVQERAEVRIRFGQLCQKLRDLDPRLTTPRTEKNRYMVICTRVQDSLKARFGRVLERCSAP